MPRIETAKHAPPRAPAGTSRRRYSTIPERRRKLSPPMM
jgi:hypothetical protein